MKLNYLKSLMIATICVMISGFVVAQTCTPSSPVCVPSNGYAFIWSSDTDYGLLFNVGTSSYEFTGGAGGLSTMVQFSAVDGDISIPGGGALQVKGNKYAFQYSTNNDYGLFFNETDAQYEFRTAGLSSVVTVGANSGDLYVTGNVGVGTSTPDEALHVSSGKLAVGNAGGVMSKITANAAPGEEIFRGRLNGTTNFIINSVGNTGMGTSVPANRLTVNGNADVSGYFGMGTSAPAYRAHIETNGESRGLYIDANNSTSTSYGAYIDNNYTGSSNDFGLYVFSNSNTSTGTRYGIRNFSTGATGSEFGITSYISSGTSSGSKYGVHSTVVSSSTTGNKYGIYSSVGGTNAWTGYFTGAPVYVSDKVGIGTTTPSYELDIDQSEVRGVNVANNYQGTSTSYGVYHQLTNTSSSGTRYGIVNTMSGSGSTSASSHFGLYSFISSSATTGSRYGVYSSVTGTNGYAGYFVGQVYVSTSGLTVGTTNQATGYMVSVNGKIICEELKVQNSIDWPDYVFDEDYELMSLDELEKNIDENNHLPGIPKADIVESEGFHVGEMTTKMMEKIEELTLYTIQQQKEIDALKEQLEKTTSR